MTLSTIGRAERLDDGHADDLNNNNHHAPQVTPSIDDLLKAGQEIIVQVVKDPLPNKGARISTHVTLPGRYLVLLPTVRHFGVSRRIEDEIERVGLETIKARHGFIDRRHCFNVEVRRPLPQHSQREVRIPRIIFNVEDLHN